MAENVNITPGSGDIIAADDIGGVKYQRVKLAWGVDGAAVDASASNPLPVVQTGTPALPTGAATETTLAALNTKTPSLGQALAAASVPVVLTAAQLTTLTPPAAITGYALDATLTNVLTIADFDTKVGALTETAPATDTASSGLNGRLQRIAQRLTTIAAIFPTTLDVGSGVLSASTIRVVLATDQPALTNKLLVTPDSVALPANQSVNISQINAVTPLMGNGVTGTGSLRVTIASDNTSFAVKPASSTAPVSTMNSASANAGLNSALAAVFDDTSPTAITENSFGFLRMSANRNLYGTIRDAAGNERGANVDASNRLTVLADQNGSNWSVNNSQINGVTPLMGNGVTGTGSQRVTIASDNTAFAVNPVSATLPVSTMNSASAAAGVNSAMAAVFDDVSPTAITENNFGFVRMSANRNQYSTIRDAAGNERGANVDASNRLTVLADQNGSNWSMNVAQINGVTPLMNNGVVGTGSLRVTIASDSTGNIATIGTSVTPGTAAANLGKAEDAAHSSADTGVMMLAVRETTLTDLSAGNTDGDYEPPQVNKSGALWVTGAPSGTSGWLVATGSIGATKTDIGTANTAGNVGGWYIYNPNASVVYVQFFNAQASAVTLGTTAPVYSLGIPASSAANIAPGMVGLSHSTAICIAITTTRAGLTGPGSTVDFNIWYKQ